MQIDELFPNQARLHFSVVAQARNGASCQLVSEASLLVDTLLSSVRPSRRYLLL